MQMTLVMTGYISIVYFVIHECGSLTLSWNNWSTFKVSYYFDAHYTIAQYSEAWGTFPHNYSLHRSSEAISGW